MLTDYRHEQTGHERGCECRDCQSLTRWDLRQQFDCNIEPGPHRFLADIYLTVIEKDRCNLLEAPLWAFELARIGDNVMAEQIEKKRKKHRRNMRSQQNPMATPWQG